MALTVPQSRSVLPEQNAPVGMDPSRQFGNQIASPINLPDVLQGQGGFQVDTSAQTNAFNHVTNSISSSVQEVINDQAKKEAALRRGNEHLDFIESQANFNKDWTEKQSLLSKMQNEGFYDADSAKEQAQKELDGLSEKYFPADKYKDPDIAQSVKLHRVGLKDSKMAGFTKDVLEPYQTAKYTERISTASAAIIDSVATTAQHSGSYEDIMASWDVARKQLVERWTSAETIAMLGSLGPEKAQAELAKQLGILAQAPARGLQARDYTPKDGEKYDQVKAARIKLGTYDIAQKVYGENKQIRLDAGQHNEVIQAGLEAKKAQQLAFLQQQEAEAARKAEAAAKKAVDNRTLAMLRDLERNGTDSPYLNPDNIKGVDAAGFEKVAAASRAAQARGATVEQKVNTVDTAIRVGARFVMPGKEEIETVDMHEQRLKQGTDFKKLSPVEQDARLVQVYGNLGVMPTRVKSELKMGLRSADPEIVKATAARIAKWEQVNPTIINSAFTPQERGMYNNMQAGNSFERSRKVFDASSDLTKEDLKNNADRLKAQSGVKHDYELTDKNNAAFKSAFSTWVGSNAEVPAKLLKEHDQKVSEFFNVTGDYKTALKMATDEMKTKSGISNVNGNKVVMRVSPEVVTGASTDKLEKQLNGAVDDIVKLKPELAVIPKERFILVEDARTSTKNKKWQIMYKDDDGFVMPIPHPQTNKPFAYFEYDNKADIEEYNKKQEKEMKALKRERDYQMKNDAIEGEKQSANKTRIDNFNAGTHDADGKPKSQPNGTSWNDMQAFKPRNAR